MKIHLQDPHTRQYLRCDSEWTANVAQALDFKTMLDITNYGVHRLKQPFLIYLRFPRPELDVTIEIFAAKKEPISVDA